MRLEINRHPAGYWAEDMLVLAEDIRDCLSPKGDGELIFSSNYYEKVELFFLEIYQILEGATGISVGPYQLALRALGLCPDTPYVMVDGRIADAMTLEEANTTLLELVTLVETKNGTPEDWWYLADFLERIYVIDTTDCSLTHVPILVSGVYIH